MKYENYSAEELIRLIEQRDITIARYESISGIYRIAKNQRWFGGGARVIAGMLKTGKRSATKIVDNIMTENPEIIAVCNPNYTGGVKSATTSLSSDILMVSDILSRSMAKRIALILISHKPKKILISGYSIGYDLLVEEIAKGDPGIKIFVYIHSAFIWFDTYQDENSVFENMLKLAKEGKIYRLGFCKKDLAEYFGQKGYNTCFVMNRFSLSQVKHEFKKGNGLKIGVWGQNVWHRNILNQVIAGLMIDGAEVHVNEITTHGFLDMTRVVVHGILPKKDFDKVFEQMDINLYVSLTDCFPMTLVESLEQGVPAIASDTSDVYSFDKTLKSDLVLSAIDSPTAIKGKIEAVLKNYAHIQEKMSKYLPQLHEEVENSIKYFLSCE